MKSRNIPLNKSGYLETITHSIVALFMEEQFVANLKEKKKRHHYSIITRKIITSDLEHIGES